MSSQAHACHLLSRTSYGISSEHAVQSSYNTSHYQCMKDLLYR